MYLAFFTEKHYPYLIIVFKLCILCLSWPRFSAANKKSLKVYVLQSVQDQLGRHSIPTDNVSRNLLKFFTAAVGLPDVRLLVAQKVDSWIQNPKVCMCVCKCGGGGVCGVRTVCCVCGWFVCVRVVCVCIHAYVCVYACVHVITYGCRQGQVSAFQLNYSYNMKE